MVRTRHSLDARADSPEQFLSLQGRKARGLNHQQDHNDDDSSSDDGVIQFKHPGKRATLKRESPTVKRASRATAKRVSYVEDFIDDQKFPRRRTSRRFGTRSLMTEDGDDLGDLNHIQLDGTITDEDHSPESRRTNRNNMTDDDDQSPEPRRASRRRNVVQALCDTHAYDVRPKRRVSADGSIVDPRSKQAKMEALSEIEESGIRRSSRTKKLIYDTLEQKVLERGGLTSEEKRKRIQDDSDNEATDDDEDGKNFTDMYSRVKRKRTSVKRDMYGMPIEESDDQADEEGGDSDDGSGEEEEEEDNEEEEQSKDERAPRSYYLRENKPRTQLYNIIHEKKPRSRSRFFRDALPTTDRSPVHRRRSSLPSYMSPARRKILPSRRKAAMHGSSSTSSSSSGSSSDEEHFQKRKAKSMMLSRQRCLPMNFDPKDISKSTLLRDRQKIGASLADIDPMNIDRSVTFDSVGGLGKHIQALKEMVVFPLLYPEIFERFKITAPKGCLFYGPPGTGKTLVARALANECSQEDRRVAFYMRKGADCLSKWVGESERQLRLLFDQAYQTRPSIIFFDEIDGLAPVRSSRQDQIHSSIVSTLLALMDGLDSRGEIVVIGATNRIDSIDPALRRPGRFDREFLFPLPSLQARSQILKINTKEWNPKLSERFVMEVAEKCIGYCGADVKALCTEAVLLAVRRRYPQIYSSSEKLQIDVSSININAHDFLRGMQNIVPTSQRSVSSPARALLQHLVPLLKRLYDQILEQINETFPSILCQLSSLDAPNKPDGQGTADDTELYADEENINIFEQKQTKRRKSSQVTPPTLESFLKVNNYATRHVSTYRPRLLLCGCEDQGQSSHLAPAILHHLEQLPVHTLDLRTLHAASTRTPEESCALIFNEARRTLPSVIYLPHINQWWHVIGDTLRTTLLTLVQDLDPSVPLLLLATSEQGYGDLDWSLQDLFDEYCGEVIAMTNPTQEERREFFSDLLLNQATKPPIQPKDSGTQVLEVLPKAPPPEPRKLTEQELKKLHTHEEATLTELRLFLRDVLNKLGRDRKFYLFTKPVDVEDVPDYYDIIQNPMDLSTMMSKIDLHKYQSVSEFMEDIKQICRNALEYNPDKDPQSKDIRHRACALQDTSFAIIKAELDPEFEKTCEGIVESRKKRGEDQNTAPAFYHTKPLNSATTPTSTMTQPQMSVCQPQPEQRVDPNVRTSRRLNRTTVDEVPSLEEVERRARAARSLIRLQMSPNKEQSNNNTPLGKPSNESVTLKNNTEPPKKSQGSSSVKRAIVRQCSLSSIRKKKKSIWGRSSYTSRKNRRRHFRNYNTPFLTKTDAESIESSEDEDEMNNITKSDGEATLETSEKKESLFASLDEKCSQEQLPNKSPRRNSLSQCLNIDVNSRSPRGDEKRSPTSPASPSRPIGQLCPNIHHETPSNRLLLPEICQRSPRHRHSSGVSNSSRSQADNQCSLDSLHKSPRSLASPSQRGADKSGRFSPRVTSAVHTQDENSNLNVPQGYETNKSVSGTKDTDAVEIVVNGFVDSGISSSDSSNSNDSAAEQLKQQVAATVDPVPSTSNSQVNSISSGLQENTEEDMEISEKKEESPVFRVTRSHTQIRTQERDTSCTDGQSMVIDRERLVRLLDLSVMLTEGFSVPCLEKLYNLYAQCIYQHRQDYNKTVLIEVMERRLKQYTSSISEKRRVQRTLTNTQAAIRHSHL